MAKNQSAQLVLGAGGGGLVAGGSARSALAEDVLAAEVLENLVAAGGVNDGRHGALGTGAEVQRVAAIAIRRNPQDLIQVDGGLVHMNPLCHFGILLPKLPGGDCESTKFQARSPKPIQSLKAK